MIVLLIIALVAGIYYIYFSGEIDNNTAKILYVFLTVLLIYAIYIPTKKFIKNEPVLTLSNSDLEINEKGKSVSFLWLQVVDWRIEKDEENNTHYLVLHTADTKKKINISWLDKKPHEIEELFRKYKA